MPFWTVPAAMAVGGMIKNEMIDKPEHAAMQQKQADMAAAQTEFSAASGLGAGQFTPSSAPSSLDKGMQYGMAGLQLEQGMNGKWGKDKPNPYTTIA